MIGPLRIASVVVVGLCAAEGAGKGGPEAPSLVALTRSEQEVSDKQEAAVKQASKQTAASKQKAKGKQGARFEGGYEDIMDASDQCGSKTYVTTCGFEDKDEYCTGDGDEEKCYRGICVCTGDDCDEPTCESVEDAECDGYPCAKKGECIVKEGSGWSCWHPCNYEHEPGDFGEHYEDLVYEIRGGTHCNQDDPHFDAGIRLGALKSPMSDTASDEYAGGESRRRAGPLKGMKEGDAAVHAAPLGGLVASLAILTAALAGHR